MKNETSSPHSRAFLNKELDTSGFRVPGLVKNQKELCRKLLSSRQKESVENLVNIISRYISGIESQFIQHGIDQNALIPSSLAAFITLSGIRDVYRGNKSQYSRIHKIVGREQDRHKVYQSHGLFLEITSGIRLYHSISITKKIIRFRTSLTALNLPDEYFTALAEMLFSRIRKKPVRQSLRQILLQYENLLQDGNLPSPVSRQKTDHGRGNHRNLNEIFDELNQEYFDGKMKKPWLMWSRRKSRKRLGFYDGIQNRIMINPILDDAELPDFVLHGIVYHELLHMIHPVVSRNGRRIIHGRNFKKDERKFREYLKLERWLKEKYPELHRRR